MLQRLLGQKPETPSTETTSVDKWLQDLVAPHVAQDLGAQYQQLIQLIDATVSQLLRSILHSPAFQRLEALWLATDALLTEEAAERHDCYLIDISQDELTAAIGSGAAGDFSQKLLQHSQTADPEQDVLLLGDFCFAANDSDDALLAYCSSLAASCGGQFLAAVDQSFLERSAKAGVSANLMLAYPRYLARLPYGDKRDPIEAFAFEECSAIPQAGELLWANPAFLLARAMLRIAAEETAAEAQFFGDIPAFSFDQDGEPKLQPAVESVLTEAQANAVLALGIVPLVGYQQRRGIRLLGVGV
jgi:predicted component of type VI protein secretion system